MLAQGVEMTAIWQRLQENYGYQGSYSAVRRFVHRLRPVEPEVFVRVQTAPGEELQVDFTNAGQLFDPHTGRLRAAYVFVPTLSYSRHQYAEFSFDQKVPTLHYGLVISPTKPGTPRHHPASPAAFIPRLYQT